MTESLVGCRLLVYAKAPVLGTVKTRLQPAIGEQACLRLHTQMLRQVLALAREVGVAAQCHLAGTQPQCQALAREWRLPVLPQSGEDLGQRMWRGFAQAFADGAERVVVIGGDCPWLTPGDLRQAFDLLGCADVVMKPAHDGGYVLLGLSTPAPALFAGLAWGTDTVAGQTRQQARDQRLTLQELQPIGDVDRPEDLHALSACPDYAWLREFRVDNR